jgi:hypothetical protein
MNHRYLRIIATCAIIGSLTLALKQNNQGKVPVDKIPNLKTSMDVEAQTVTAAPKKKMVSAGNITIKPNISSKDLEVHKMGTHSPRSFMLTINGEEVEVNNNEPITVKVDGAKQVKTRCRWEFMMNHKGENDATWQVEPGKEYIANFSWDEPSKIKIDGAELIEARKLTPEEYKATEEKKTANKKRRSSAKLDSEPSKRAKTYTPRAS